MITQRLCGPVSSDESCAMIRKSRCRAFRGDVRVKGERLGVFNPKACEHRVAVFLFYIVLEHRQAAPTSGSRAATDNKQHTKHLSIRITRRKMNEPMMSSSSSSLGCVHTWWLFIKEYFMKLSVVVGRRVILLADFFALLLCLSPPFTFIDSSSPQMNIMMTSLCLGPQILIASERASCCCCKKKLLINPQKEFWFCVSEYTSFSVRTLDSFWTTLLISLLVYRLLPFGEDCWSIKETKPSIKNAKNNTLDDDLHWAEIGSRGGSKQEFQFVVEWELETSQHNENWEQHKTSSQCIQHTTQKSATRPTPKRAEEYSLNSLNSRFVVARDRLEAPLKETLK